MDMVALEKKAEKALNYLADTDVEHAELKAKQNLLSELRKTVVAAGFAGSKEKAQEARKQDAYNTPELAEHLALMEQVDIDFMTLHNKRQRAIATMDLYRTVCANQRRGQ